MTPKRPYTPFASLNAALREYTLSRVYRYAKNKTLNIFELLRRGNIDKAIHLFLLEVLGNNLYWKYINRSGHDGLVVRRIRGNKMYIDKFDRGIGRDLLINGIHEGISTPVFERELARLRDEVPGTVGVLEIGANIGYYVLLEAQSLGSQARIYALEPEPRNRELLGRNVRMNGLKEVVDIDPYAINDETGVELFRLAEGSNHHHLVSPRHDQTTGSNAQTLKVETRTVDGILDEKGIDPESIHAVRMDIEGLEAKIIPSMRRLFEAEGPLVLFTELHPEYIDDETLVSILELMANNDFKIISVVQDGPGAFGGHRMDLKSFHELSRLLRTRDGTVGWELIVKQSA